MGAVCSQKVKKSDIEAVINAHKLFFPFKLGGVVLKNRFVMAALTRCRCNAADGVPTDLHVQYYAERAESAGLVVTECVYVSENGHAFPGAAGILTKEQIEGWKKVTTAVHQKKGLIFIQLYHCGRGVQGGKAPEGVM